jgi:hypothetical protein
MAFSLAVESGSLEVIQFNLVIFLMSSYEFYINRSDAKYDPDDQAILIPFNIEHVEIVAYCVDISEHLSQFVKVCPIRPLSYEIPDI